MDTLEIVQKRVDELQPLYNRMDKTRDLAYHTPFKLKNFDGIAIDNVVNVTTNWPGIYANAIISDLMGAVWQTVIESEKGLSDKQKHDIENFIEDNLAQADEQLGRKGIADLFTWLCNHVCIRSLIGARWISQFDGDSYKIDCLPVDMRWTPFEFGNDGLNWVAYKSTRSATRVKAQYGIDVGTEDIEVTDFWDSKQNKVYLEGEMAPGWPKKHGFGQPPFVIAIPSSGFMLRDKGWIEHEAEDLFFLNRGLYDERSRQMSIEQTLGMDVLFPPYEQETEEPGKPADKPPKTGETTKVKTGERHQLLPRGDISNAFRAGHADVQRDLQMGGVNDIDLGTVSQTVSAVWITEQSEIRNKLIKPRLKALASFRQQLARMMIDQYIKISEKAKKSSSEIEVGVAGRKRKYSAKQLGDPGTYTITNELMSKSKKQEFVNLAMFEAAKGELPLRVRLTDILMADDPDGIMRELEIEGAKRADPALALFEMAVRYAEDAENLEGLDAETRKIESMMLTEKGCSIIRQRALGTEPTEETKVAGEEPTGSKLQALMPLLGQGGVAGGGRRRPEETMEETIGEG